jgi:hypothetical protein
MVVRVWDMQVSPQSKRQGLLNEFSDQQVSGMDILGVTRSGGPQATQHAVHAHATDPSL